MVENEIEDKFESFVEAMYQASNIILEESPDFVVAPMNGSVPFIDAMAIVNSNFDTSKVVYMPASSRIEGVNEVINEWYFNFLNDTVIVPGRIPKTIGLDEVVSGGSVTRCIHCIDRAITAKKTKETLNLVHKLTSHDPAESIKAVDDIDTLTENAHSYDFSVMRRKVQEGYYRRNPDAAKADLQKLIGIFKEDLARKLTYRSIGIEDSKLEGRRNKEYFRLKANGRIISVGVRSIITMDIPDFCPPRFMEKPDPSGRGGYVKYLPNVRDFYVTPRYLDFLQRLAVHVGKDPNSVNPVNLIPIVESNKYLPSYRH